MLIPFVARAGVLADLDSALTAVRAGRGALLMITGSACENSRRLPRRPTRPPTSSAACASRPNGMPWSRR
jgi:hypothetical protein